MSTLETNKIRPISGSTNLTIGDSGDTITLTSGAKTSGFGKIGQVLQTNKTDQFSTSSSSFIDVTGLSVSITPSSTSSKVLVMFSIQVSNSNASYGTHIRLMRDSTEIAPDAESTGYTSSWHKFYGDTNITNVMAYQFLDSPSSSSALSYKLQIKPQAGTSRVNKSGSDTASQPYSQDRDWETDKP